MRVYPADAAGALFKGVVGAGLSGYRRGLCHAVADGHTIHVHLCNDLLHHFDRAGRACHNAGAQRRQIKAFKIRMGQFGYEHGWHAIQTGAAFLGYGRQYGFGLEGFIGKHHAGTMAGAAQITHHHTEAVIQRHRNTHPVLVCIATAFGNKVTVVKDIAMGQRGAFGQAGSA